MTYRAATLSLYKRYDDLWSKPSFPKISFDAAGLVALADLTTIARRTALTGTSSLLDALVICPGLHRQQAAPELSLGEYPATANMSTGYVFRVENQATVLFLQSVGKTSHLTTLTVETTNSAQSDLIFAFSNAALVPTLAYLSAVVLTSAIIVFSLAGDWWGLGVLGVLIVARACNVFVIRRRAKLGWKGLPEPGVKGDLLVLLSNDRWVRIKGLTDDLKTITAGEWLREQSFPESCITAFATVLVYLNAAVSSNVTNWGKVVLVMVLIVSVGLLAIANKATTTLSMHGRVLKLSGERKAYKRRLLLAEELIKETGRDDWAMKLGMINKNVEKEHGGVTM